MSTAEPTPALQPRELPVRFELPAAKEGDPELRRSVTILAQLGPLAAVAGTWMTEHLNKKMLAVVHLVGQGLPNKTIAKRLACSIRSVESYRAKAKTALSPVLGRPANNAEFITCCTMLAAIRPEQVANFSLATVLVKKEELPCAASV